MVRKGHVPRGSEEVCGVIKLCCNIFLFFWFIDPIVQIAIDNSRNTLFTRSEKGVLQVWCSLVILLNFPLSASSQDKILWLSLCCLVFPGVWPGCWWTGHESCGNYVPELHCCGCWKHSQVSLFDQSAFVISGKKHSHPIELLSLSLSLLPLQDNRPFCFQTNCSDLCDW